MIRYMLQCEKGHRFESWFPSGDGFDALVRAGQIDCPDCGSREISKSPMAPALASNTRKSSEQTRVQDAHPLSTPRNAREEALAAMRRAVEENSDYVGMKFSSEARKMHAGEIPARTIHGEAKLEEAREMIEEGIAVMPLPFVPGRKTN
ncbi:DUF1178 family protein [Thioclava sp. BHET1]|nr:DUF1178 family protein [Thioclava sp. BHET1]